MSPKAPSKSSSEEDEVPIKKTKVAKKPVKITAAATKAKTATKVAADDSSDEEDDEEDEEGATLKQGAKKSQLKNASVKKATKCANQGSSNDDENPAKKLKTKKMALLKKKLLW